VMSSLLLEHGGTDSRNDIFHKRLHAGMVSEKQLELVVIALETVRVEFIGYAETVLSRIEHETCRFVRGGFDSATLDDGKQLSTDWSHPFPNVGQNLQGMQVLYAGQTPYHGQGQWESINLFL